MDKVTAETYEQIRTHGIDSEPDAAKALAEYEKALQFGHKNPSLFLDKLETYSHFFYKLGMLWFHQSMYLSISAGSDDAIRYLAKKLEAMLPFRINLPHLCFYMGCLLADTDPSDGAYWFQQSVEGEDFGIEMLQKCKAESQKYLMRMRAGSSPADETADYYIRGLAAARAGELDDALEAFDTCLCMSPPPAIAIQAWYNLAVTIHNKFHFFERDGEDVPDEEKMWCLRISRCAAMVRDVYETQLADVSNPQLSATLEHIYSEAKDLQNRYMVYGLTRYDPASGKSVRRDYYAIYRMPVAPLRCMAEYESEQRQRTEQEMLAKRREAGECETCGTKLGFFDKAGGNVRCKAHR